MVYTVIMNNRSYELPKKTVFVMEDLDSALSIDKNKSLSLREKYGYLHEFVKRMVGEERARECFGSDLLDEIDLSDLTIAVRKIHDAYDKPIAEYEAGKMQEKFKSIPLEKISPLMTALTTANAELK